MHFAHHRAYIFPVTLQKRALLFSLDEAFIKRIAGVTLGTRPTSCGRLALFLSSTKAIVPSSNLRYLLYKNVGRLKNVESFDKIFR
jgi:hypothetical protein